MLISTNLAMPWDRGALLGRSVHVGGVPVTFARKLASRSLQVTKKIDTSCRRDDQFFSDNLCSCDRLFRKRAVRFENERYRFVEVLASLFERIALCICTGQLLYEGYIAFRHLHENSRELNRHRANGNRKS